MRWFSSLFLVSFFCLPCPGADLPRATPESQGIDSGSLNQFVIAADQKFNSLNSLMVVRHGKVVAEGWWAPYEPQARHSLYSLSKSFTSTAIGLAIAEGKLSLDDEVLKFFPDEAPAKPSANLKSMRVSDLLRMSTGHQSEPPLSKTESWVKAFLAQWVPFKPGTHFLYNTPATYMCSAIVQKVTGKTLLEYLKPRLFDPLGIENPTWEKSPQGISTGGYGLSVRTEDIAKFGQLYLQKGKWQGKQLVPESWIDAATARQTSNGSSPKSDWDQGYGYQFWRCRHGAYRGDGAFGQYCIVVPEQDTVIAITSGLGDMQAVLNLVWEKILPAIKSGELPENEATRTELQKTLKGLGLKTPAGSHAAATVSDKRFEFEANDRKLGALTLQGDGKENPFTIVAKFGDAEERISCGNGTWIKSKAAWGGLPSQPLAASGAWTSADTFTAKVCFYETPFVLTIRLEFSPDEVKLDAATNVGFGPVKQGQLVGKLKK